MSDDDDTEVEDETTEEKTPVKKKRTTPAVVQIDNHETNELLGKIISLLTPPTPANEEKKENDNPKKEGTDEPERGGLRLFRNPFDKPGK